MHEQTVAAAVVLLGLVVPGIVFGLMLVGRASFGQTSIVTASWTLCTGLIAAYRYDTVGVDGLFVAAVILMAASMLWTWSYRDHLVGPLLFGRGGVVDHMRLPPGTVAAIVPRAGDVPERDDEMTSDIRKENE